MYSKSNFILISRLFLLLPRESFKSTAKKEALAEKEAEKRKQDKIKQRKLDSKARAKSGKSPKMQIEDFDSPNKANASKTHMVYMNDQGEIKVMDSRTHQSDCFFFVKAHMIKNFDRFVGSKHLVKYKQRRI